MSRDINLTPGPSNGELFSIEKLDVTLDGQQL